MSMNEMMRDSANQKREQEKRENEIREAVEELTTTVNELARNLEETAQGETTPNKEIIDKLATIQRQIAAMKTDETPTAEKVAEQMSRQLTQIRQTLAKLPTAEDINGSATVETASQLVDAAESKEKRATEHAETMEREAKRTRQALGEMKDQASTIKHATAKLENVPENLRTKTNQARRELTKPIRNLGLKSAGLLALTVLIVNVVLLGAGTWFLSHNDLSLTIQTDTEKTKQQIGEQTAELMQTEWDDEEYETWRDLMRYSDPDEETTNN